MKTKSIVIPFLLAALCLPAAAQSADTFATVLDAICAASTQPRAAHLRAEAEASEAAAANAVAPTELGVDHVWGASGVGNKLAVTLSQSFDWPGLYSARSNAAAAARAAAQEQEAALTREVRLEAKLKLIELVYVRRQLQMMRTAKAHTDTLQASVERAYRGGELTILDTKKVAIEQYKLDAEISALMASQSALCGDLQAMCPGIDLKLDGIADYPAEQRRTPAEYASLTATHSAAARTALLTAQAEHLSAKAASRAALPGFSIGYQYQREMGDTFNGFTLGLTLPAWQGRKTASAARARAAAAALEHEQAVATAAADTRAACQQLELWASQIQAYRSTIGDDSYLTLLTKAYRGGQLSVIDYITEALYYIDATRACHESEYNYFSTLARLNSYAGIDD